MVFHQEIETDVAAKNGERFGGASGAVAVVAVAVMITIMILVMIMRIEEQEEHHHYWDILGHTGTYWDILGHSTHLCGFNPSLVRVGHWEHERSRTVK